MVHLQTPASMANNNAGKIDVAKSVKDNLDWFECYIDPSLFSNSAVATNDVATSATAAISPKTIAKRSYITPPHSVSPPTSTSLPISTSAPGATTPALPSAPNAPGAPLLTTPPLTTPAPPPAPSSTLTTGPNNKRQKRQEQTQPIPRNKNQKMPGYEKVTPSTMPRPLRRPGPSLSGLRAANQTLTGFIGAKYSGNINSQSGGINVKTTASNFHQTYFPVRDPTKVVQQPGHQNHHHHCYCHHTCTRDVSPSVIVAAQDEINDLKTKIEKLEKVVYELSAKVDSSQKQPASVV